jgi:16S rRNA (uracil1498-N3)-methyltransferase
MKVSKYNRIYIAGNLVVNEQISLSEEHSHYLTIVLRQRAGDRIRVFNHEQGEYLAKLYTFGKKDYKLEILEKLRDPENPAPLIAAPAIIKNEKFLLSLEKSVELGATKICPLMCARSQLRTLNIPRLERCIIEATEQSERLSVPQINAATMLANFIQDIDVDNILVCNENEVESKSIKHLPEGVLKGSLAVVVGPEGGFSDDEIKFLDSSSKVISVSLGHTLLRSETAMLVALSQIQLMRAL